MLRREGRVLRGEGRVLRGKGMVLRGEGEGAERGRVLRREGY